MHNRKMIVFFVFLLFSLTNAIVWQRDLPARHLPDRSTNSLFSIYGWNVFAAYTSNTTFQRSLFLLDEKNQLHDLKVPMWFNATNYFTIDEHPNSFDIFGRALTGNGVTFIDSWEHAFNVTKVESNVSFVFQLGSDPQASVGFRLRPFSNLFFVEKQGGGSFVATPLTTATLKSVTRPWLHDNKLYFGCIEKPWPYSHGICESSMSSAGTRVVNQFERHIHDLYVWGGKFFAIMEADLMFGRNFGTRLFVLDSVRGGAARQVTTGAEGVLYFDIWGHSSAGVIALVSYSLANVPVPLYVSSGREPGLNATQIALVKRARPSFQHDDNILLFGAGGNCASAEKLDGACLWRTDGTASGTYPISGTAAGDSIRYRLPLFHSLFARHNGMTYISLGDPSHGKSIVRTNGTGLEPVWTPDTSKDRLINPLDWLFVVDAEKPLLHADNMLFDISSTPAKPVDYWKFVPRTHCTAHHEEIFELGNHEFQIYNENGATLSKSLPVSTVFYYGDDVTNAGLSTTAFLNSALCGSTTCVTKEDSIDFYFNDADVIDGLVKSRQRVFASPLLGGDVVVASTGQVLLDGSRVVAQTPKLTNGFPLQSAVHTSSGVRVIRVPNTELNLSKPYTFNLTDLNAVNDFLKPPLQLAVNVSSEDGFRLNIKDIMLSPNAPHTTLWITGFLQSTSKPVVLRGVISLSNQMVTLSRVTNVTECAMLKITEADDLFGLCSYVTGESIVRTNTTLGVVGLEKNITAIVLPVYPSLVDRVLMFKSWMLTTTENIAIDLTSYQSKRTSGINGTFVIDSWFDDGTALYIGVKGAGATKALPGMYYFNVFTAVYTLIDYGVVSMPIRCGDSIFWTVDDAATPDRAVGIRHLRQLKGNKVSTLKSLFGIGSIGCIRHQTLLIHYVDMIKKKEIVDSVIVGDGSFVPTAFDPSKPVATPKFATPQWPGPRVQPPLPPKTPLPAPGPTPLPSESSSSRATTGTHTTPHTTIDGSNPPQPTTTLSLSTTLSSTDETSTAIKHSLEIIATTISICALSV